MPRTRCKNPHEELRTPTCFVNHQGEDVSAESQQTLGQSLAQRSPAYRVCNLAPLVENCLLSRRQRMQLVNNLSMVDRGRGHSSQFIGSSSFPSGKLRSCPARHYVTLVNMASKHPSPWSQVKGPTSWQVLRHAHASGCARSDQCWHKVDRFRQDGNEVLSSWCHVCIAMRSYALVADIHPIPTCSRGCLGGASVAPPRCHLLGTAGVGAGGRKLQVVEAHGLQVHVVEPKMCRDMVLGVAWL